jgi:hypothetical protein
MRIKHEPILLMAIALIGGGLFTLASAFYLQRESWLRVYGAKCEQFQPVPKNCIQTETVFVGAGWPLVYLYRAYPLVTPDQELPAILFERGPSRFKISAFVLNWCIFAAGIFGLIYVGRQYFK